MAYQDINGIRLIFPDSPCLIFNPCIFKLSGTMARTRVYVSANGQQYNATYQTPNGGELDLRQFLQVMFDGLIFGGDLAQLGQFKGSELGKSVSITIIALDESGTSLAQFNRTIFCVWGGTDVGENYSEDARTRTKKAVWFKGYPFSVGLYTSASKQVDLVGYTSVPQDGGTIRSLSLPRQGVYNIRIDDEGDSDNNYISIIDHASPYAEHWEIAIDRTADEGVYLRWVDRHGFWCYRLFKPGDDTRTAASRFGMWNRNNLANYYGMEGWQRDSGRRQSFTRTDVIPLCAPLVDRETFDALQDITTSPVIDMYIGLDANDEPMWTAVTVEAGQYTRDVKKPEQDFQFNLVLPEIPVQSL